MLDTSSFSKDTYTAYVMTILISNTPHSDLTGRFPVASDTVNQYLFMPTMDGYIHAETLPTIHLSIFFSHIYLFLLLFLLFIIILRNEGVLGFFRGVFPNALKVAPAAALTFLVYEECLKFLTSPVSSTGLSTGDSIRSRFFKTEKRI